MFAVVGALLQQILLTAVVELRMRPEHQPFAVVGVEACHLLVLTVLTGQQPKPGAPRRLA